MHLPEKEKDRLLLRLLKKDLPLVNRLYFELLDERTVEDRREAMEERIRKGVERASSFWKPNYLKTDMGYMSGDITQHVAITKDKYGEAALNLFMLNQVLEHNGRRLMKYSPAEIRKFSVYVIAKAFKLLLLIDKLHEDCLLDFKEDLEKLGRSMGQYPYLMETAIYHGLDVNWLVHGEIPEDIDQIHKDLRGHGYLK